MNSILAIDPGVKGIGWAWIASGVLTDCGYEPFTSLYDLRRWIDSQTLNLSGMRVICEVPQVYRVSQSKGDPNDLINVALVSGMCLSAAKASVQVRPHGWKGTVPKDIHNKRILADARVDAVREKLEKVKKTLRHNVIDAIGIALWWIDKGGADHEANDGRT